MTRDRGRERDSGLHPGLPVAGAVFLAVLLLWRPGAGAVPGGDPGDLVPVAATALLMAILWMTEALPIPVTSLLPTALLPLLAGDPFDLGRVTANYANWRVFLFFGGFLIAIAMERSELHRRVALRTVQAIGTRPRRIVLGFMLATAVLSMWISNTATALLMLPIGMAVIQHFEGRRRFAVALMLGIAYSASVGGIATPIGTPPNISFQGIYARMYPDAPPIGFASWMAFALPLVVVFLPVVWLVLVARMRSGAGDAADVLRQAAGRLGPMRTAERRVLVVFLLTAFLWIFRQPIDVGAVRIPGWSALLPGARINDGVVAMAMALSLFVIGDGEGGRLLDWRTAQRKTPWGILLLFGGGFALADAIDASGLSAWIGAQFVFLQGLPPVLLVASTALVLTFLTELTSNTATAQVMLPVAAGVATTTLGVDPLLLMLPVTVAASCAFMLPVATPPNAVVFGSGAIDMRDMVRHGVILNLIGVVLVTLVVWLVAPYVFGIDPGSVPGWAR